MEGKGCSLPIPHITGTHITGTKKKINYEEMST